MTTTTSIPLTDQLRQALETLLDYSDHRPDCNLAQTTYAGMCTCGYRAAYRAAADALARAIGESND